MDKQLQVFEETTSHELRQSCEVWDGAYWFGIPVGNASMGRIGSCAIEENMVAVRPGGVPFQLHTPSSFRIFGIVVDRNLLQRYIADTEGIELDTDLLHRETLNAGTAANLLLKQELLQIFEAPALLLSHEHARQELRGRLLHAFAMQCLTQADVPKPSLTYVGRHRLVQRTRDYAAAAAGTPICIQEICRALHVSRRTLQYAFEEVCDISPAAYLRILRLNCARRALRDRTSAFNDVRGIAAQSGFWHPSQFATDYRRFFGEKPSDTLRRRTAPFGIAESR
ncbi:MAG: helix-turn-helix domain-containing protein [Acidobacteriaceae bacterium]|nr:helix-turn-helix domain-containing protein [Acidobacteriaceae bacterium]